VPRSIADRAIKGDGGHAKLFHQLVATAQKERAREQQSYFQSLCNYKWKWEEEFARCDEQGLPRPDPIPHPDDIVVNPRTGEASL
jgi:hypothetical protein